MLKSKSIIQCPSQSAQFLVNLITELFHFVFTVGLVTYVIVAKIKSFNLRANGDHRESMVNATGVSLKQPARFPSHVALLQLQHVVEIFNRYLLYLSATFNEALGAGIGNYLTTCSSISAASTCC